MCHGVLGEFFVFQAEFQRIPCSRILFADLGSPLRKLCGMGNSIGVAAYRTQHLTIHSGVYHTPAPGAHSYATIASKCKYPSTVKPLPYGRYPINGRYAGGLWRNSDRSIMPENWPYGDIPFTKEGVPDFTRHVEKFDPLSMKAGASTDLVITPTGRRYKDIRVRLPSFSGHPISTDLVSVGEDVHCESTAQEVHVGLPA